MNSFAMHANGPFANCQSSLAAFVAAGAVVAVLCLSLSRGAEREVPSPVAGALPVGSIVAFAGAIDRLDPARDWMLCDGRELSARSHPELFTAIGTAWGGRNNPGSFLLPDLRGRFLRGVNFEAGGEWRDLGANERLPSADGANAGNNVGSVQPDSVGPHYHDLAGPANATGPGTGAEWIRFFAAKIPDPDSPVLVNTAAVQPNDGTETRPANVYVHWIIRVR
jgi:hypothetical protein